MSGIQNIYLTAILWGIAIVWGIVARVGGWREWQKSPAPQVIQDPQESTQAGAGLSKRQIAENLAVLYRRGEGLKREILADEAEWKDEWRERGDTWRQDTRQSIADNLSLGKALYFDSLQGLTDVVIFYGGKGVPRRKGNLVQELEARLSKLSEIMKDY